MLPAVLSFVLALLLVPQQVPADTTQPAADTQAVALPPLDTSRITPLPPPSADTLSSASVQTPPTTLPQQPPSQESPSDTATAAAPDTASAAPPDTHQTAAADTVAADARPAETGPLRSEWERVQAVLSQQVAQFRQALSLTRLLLALLALALTFVVVQVVIWLLERLARWHPVQASRIRRIVPLVKFGLWFVGVWIVAGSLFAGSTLVMILLVLLVVGGGMVAGFQFLRDLAGGLVLTFEQPFQLGSRVAIGPHRGEVRKIGLRSFELAAPDGATVVVPNAEVLRQPITATPPDVRAALVTVELTMPAQVDPDTARRLMREAAYASPYVAASQPVRVTLVPNGNERLQLHVEATVFDAAHAEALRSDVVRLAHAAFALATGNEKADGE